MTTRDDVSIYVLRLGCGVIRRHKMYVCDGLKLMTQIVNWKDAISKKFCRKNVCQLSDQNNLLINQHAWNVLKLKNWFRHS